MLPVDIGQVRGEFLQQRSGHRTAAHEGPRFAAGEDFALDQQLTLLGLQTGGLQHAADRGMVSHIEDAGYARPRLARANRLGRGARAEQKAQSIHHDRLAAAGLACQQI